MQTLEIKYRLEDLAEVSKDLLQHFDSKTILFYGDMGVGKTTLISALLKALGSSDVASSPTFSIVNEYKTPKDKVYHFDLFRIESIDDAFNFGIEDYLYTDNWIFIEWPGRIEGLLPDNACAITIIELDNQSRSLKLTMNNRSLTENNAMTVPKL
ncbi:tRNA (adenosine(37)-N6)-threonylcarbamoyltransferase complex ATPase subunit type 1 TsaE [Winogradskyella poriferorum]|uniref:tRNA (adenosine(37)-N6)-threonylcarbamoyltransferase complex ATPase subunit type 1 TsaE n=1 Tax=Winogradskyella poriferorum TaxID=307627 RepID=UPI003D64FCFC